MKRWSAALLLIVAAGSTMLATGCSQAPIQSPPSPSDTGRLFADLPAPQGFEYRENISDTSPTGAFRVVTQVLRGPHRRIEATADFYRKTLPAHGWTLERDEGKAPETVKLSFVKLDERCRLEILDESAAVVRVNLKVGRKE